MSKGGVNLPRPQVRLSHSTESPLIAPVYCTDLTNNIVKLLKLLNRENLFSVFSVFEFDVSHIKICPELKGTSEDIHASRFYFLLLKFAPVCTGCALFVYHADRMPSPYQIYTNISDGISNWDISIGTQWLGRYVDLSNHFRSLVRDSMSLLFSVGTYIECIPGGYI